MPEVAADCRTAWARQRGSPEASASNASQTGRLESSVVLALNVGNVSAGGGADQTEGRSAEVEASAPSSSSTMAIPSSDSFFNAVPTCKDSGGDPQPSDARDITSLSLQELREACQHEG